jgi:chromosome segregation ATPase
MSGGSEQTALQLAEARQEADALREECTRAKEEVSKLQQSLQQAELELGARSQEVSNVRQEHASASKSLLRVMADAEELRTRLAAKEKEVDGAEKAALELAETRKQLCESDARALQQSQKLDVLQKELAEALMAAKMLRDENVRVKGLLQEAEESMKAVSARREEHQPQTELSGSLGSALRITPDPSPRLQQQWSANKVATAVDVGERGKKGFLQKRSKWLKDYQSVRPLQGSRTCKSASASVGLR